MMRLGFNFFPAYRRTGARITYIASDLHEIHIKLPLNWKTRNYVGTIFGGSMFAAVDPIYMLMLIKLLGPNYVVWDKAASIQYKRPGRSTLYAKFQIDQEELDGIREELEQKDKLDRVYHVELIDEERTVCASIEKTIYFRRKQHNKPFDGHSA
jgi:acyl-coenzyme A thioesterase PaaI-like protein